MFGIYLHNFDIKTRENGQKTPRKAVANGDRQQQEFRRPMPDWFFANKWVMDKIVSKTLLIGAANSTSRARTKQGDY